MRQSQNRKHKNHPFLTILEKKQKTNKKSSEKQVTQTYQYLQNEPIQENSSNKLIRGKTAKQRNSSINRNYAANHSFMELGKQLKSKRSLIDENNELKKKLDLMSLGKNTKKEFSRKISSQFQKQMYWSGSQTYMISGIKLQYQKMKENFQKKSDDYQTLLKSVEACQKKELISYIEALEVENNILASGAQKKFKKSPGDAYDEQTSISMIMWLRQRLNTSEIKVEKIKQKNKNQKQEIKELKCKIKFLEKLIIEKDNNEHAALKNAKKAEKQRDQLKEHCAFLSSSLKTMKEDNQKQMQQVQKRHRQNILYQRSKLSEEHKQLHSFVLRIQRENQYLHNLVNSWKEERKEKDVESRKKIQKTFSMPMTDMAEDHIKTVKTSIMVESVGKGTVSKHTEDLESLEKQKRTEPYGADKKNSQNSIKNRRVQAYQIQDIIAFGRLVMIGKELNLQWMINQLDYQGKQQWQKQYINMLEVRTFFKKNMNLKEGDARLLARYIIEHSQTQYVYTDDLNEHSRSVVKSIVKNIFGNYPVFKEKKEEYQHLLSQWRSKLQFTLMNTTKGGTISKTRFEQLLQSLSLHKDPEFATYLQSKMILVSQSLQDLKYACLLEIPKQ